MGDIRRVTDSVRVRVTLLATLLVAVVLAFAAAAPSLVGVNGRRAPEGETGQRKDRKGG